jgi:Mn-dependent DtxR family transcriptional regulator
MILHLPPLDASSAPAELLRAAEELVRVRAIYLGAARELSRLDRLDLIDVDGNDVTLDTLADELEGAEDLVGDGANIDAVRDVLGRARARLDELELRAHGVGPVTAAAQAVAAAPAPTATAASSPPAVVDLTSGPPAERRRRGREAILNYFGEHAGHWLAASEVARALGIGPGTVTEATRELADNGDLEHNGKGGAWSRYRRPIMAAPAPPEPAGEPPEADEDLADELGIGRDPDEAAEGTTSLQRIGPTTDELDEALGPDDDDDPVGGLEAGGTPPATAAAPTLSRRVARLVEEERNGGPRASIPRERPPGAPPRSPDEFTDLERAVIRSLENSAKTIPELAARLVVSRANVAHAITLLEAGEFVARDGRRKGDVIYRPAGQADAA